MSEQWRKIDGFSDYEVSNFGRVRSNKRTCKGKVLIHSLDNRGYPKVGMLNDNKMYARRIHVLVWDAFGDNPRNGRKINVDHIDFNKTNNWISNLQLLSSRENKIKSLKTSGKLIGASRKRNKWQSKICINGKYKWLGVFNTELEAHKAYINEREKQRV